MVRIRGCRRPLQDEGTLVPNPTNETGCHKKAMENLREAVSKLAGTLSNEPLNQSLKTLLDGRFNEMVSQYKTPDHPPYSAMIERALWELNDRRGSNEDSISEFLVKEYPSLPYAHPTLLKHHLEKLCESDDIVETPNGRYMLPAPNHTADLSTKSKSRIRKRKWRHDYERNDKYRRLKKHLSIEKSKSGKVDVIQAKQLKEENVELSIPDIPPGFENIRVKNWSHAVPAEIELESGQELSELEHTQRKTRSWSRNQENQELNVVKAQVVEVVKPVTYASNKLSEDKRYGLRRQPKAKKLENFIMDLPVKSVTEPNQVKKENVKLSIPDIPPGFENIRLKNLSHAVPLEVELESGQELSELELTQRKARNWSRNHENQESDVVKAQVVEVVEPVTNASNKISEDKNYGLRRTPKAKKLENFVMDLSVKWDGTTEPKSQFEPNQLEFLLNEQENLKGKQPLRRSQRGSRAAKTEVTKECPKMMCRHRAGLSKQKPRNQRSLGPSQDSSPDELEHQVQLEQPGELVELEDGRAWTRAYEDKLKELGIERVTHEEMMKALGN